MSSLPKKTVDHLWRLAYRLRHMMAERSFVEKTPDEVIMRAVWFYDGGGRARLTGSNIAHVIDILESALKVKDGYDIFIEDW